MEVHRQPGIATGDESKHGTTSEPAGCHKRILVGQRQGQAQLESHRTGGLRAVRKIHHAGGHRRMPCRGADEPKSCAWEDVWGIVETLPTSGRQGLTRVDTIIRHTRLERPLSSTRLGWTSHSRCALGGRSEQASRVGGEHSSEMAGLVIEAVEHVVADVCALRGSRPQPPARPHHALPCRLPKWRIDPPGVAKDMFPRFWEAAGMLAYAVHGYCGRALCPRPRWDADHPAASHDCHAARSTGELAIR